MEAAGEIDPGSMNKLRTDAKHEKLGTYKQMQMLSQALSPCVGLDTFLPKPAPPGRETPIDGLCKLPVLICTADEEKKQTLGVFLYKHFKT